MTATGLEGTAWCYVSGGAAGSEGEVLHLSGVGMEQAAQGCGHRPELKKHLDNAFRHKGNSDIMIILIEKNQNVELLRSE